MANKAENGDIDPNVVMVSFQYEIEMSEPGETPSVELAQSQIA
jgi:hypothetical protein